MKKKLLFAGIVLLSLLAACQNDEALPGEEPVIEEPVLNEYQPIELTAAETQLAAQSADFAFRLLQAGDKKLPADQLYLSPLSASYALSMLANGADGDTWQELVDALGFSGFTMDEINAYNQKLVTRLAGRDETATLGVANSLWMFDDFQVLDSYREVLASDYDADVLQVEQSEAVKSINAWCDEKTNGCIPELLKGAPDGEMALLNALYFKGQWTTQFDKDDTHRDVFYNEDGTVSYVNMMHTENIFPYTQSENFSVVRLPYGNDAFGLYLLLPNEDVPISTCIANLDGKRWQALQENMSEEAVFLGLPKFTIDDCQNRLTEMLRLMGVQKLFSSEADLSKLAKDAITSLDVQQSVYFSLDEAGVEAAGVTSIIPDTDSGNDSQEPFGVTFFVDRPFLFLLTEKSTGTVLFMGKVTEL